MPKTHRHVHSYHLTAEKRQGEGLPHMIEGIDTIDTNKRSKFIDSEAKEADVNEDEEEEVVLDDDDSKPAAKVTPSSRFSIV